jgi:hypothetical protein
MKVEKLKKRKNPYKDDISLNLDYSCPDPPSKRLLL